MNKKNIIVNLPEGNFNVEVLEFDDSDRPKLANMYKEWRSLCRSLNELDARGVNLPEGLSESAVCLEMGMMRFTKSITKANTSFDAYDVNSGLGKNRIQIKACSVLPDLTSFGPKSVWDRLLFVDFYREGNWDGSFDIYEIDTLDIYNYKVNANETFKDHQEQKRRPRFSIYKGIIEAKNLRPIKTGRLW
ncbi:Bsp6I family type II restriction endonuclease [Paraclostridium bifermentans]|uniref:Bsp6I family type II restriction endonuclease n=1 Tax=Paraclostridium bifermentans TaxID=1490 RepID=UPI00374FBDFF